eukprot:365488-Chlamydomonas_euryale.AAC.6
MHASIPFVPLPSQSCMAEHRIPPELHGVTHGLQRVVKGRERAARPRPLAANAGGRIGEAALGARLGTQLDRVQGLGPSLTGCQATEWDSSPQPCHHAAIPSPGTTR